MALTLVLLLGIANSGADAAALIEPLLSRARYEAVSLAPDGTRALAVRYRAGPLAGEMESCVLLVLDLAGGGREELPLPGGRYGYFCWSPDSRRVAFLRWGLLFTEIWTYACGEGVPRLLVEPPETRRVFGLQWREDEGLDALFVLRTERSVDGREREVVLSCYHLDAGRWGPEIGRIQGLYVAQAVLAHDGSALALVASRSQPSSTAGGPLDLYRLDLPGGELRCLTAGDGIAAHPAWSPDGRTLACVWTPEPSLLSTRKREIVQFDRSGARREITFRFGLSIGDGIYGADERVWFSSSGEEILVATQRGAGDHLLAVDVGSGSARWLTTGARSFKGLSVARHGDRGLTVMSSPGVPECLVLHDLERRSFEVVDRPNASLEGLLGSFEQIRFRAADGLPLEAILVTPAGGRPPYPTVVSLHGGSCGRNTARFNDALAQMYAAHGFAVFLPNPRGSAGYGEDFASRERSPFGGEEVRDVMRAVDELVERELADPRRLFLQGHSYGAYLAAMVAAQTHRFRAVAATSGVYDWESFSLTSDLPELAEVGLGGPLDEHREAYRNASPLHLVSRMKTPFLLVHGGMDQRIPCEQSRVFHEALKEEGVTTDLVVLGAGHQIEGLEALRHWFDLSLSWFSSQDVARSR